MIETFFNYLAKEDAEVWKTVLDVVFGTILEGYGETDP